MKHHPDKKRPPTKKNSPPQLQTDNVSTDDLENTNGKDYTGDF